MLRGVKIQVHKKTLNLDASLNLADNEAISKSGRETLLYQFKVQETINGTCMSVQLYTWIVNLNQIIKMRLPRSVYNDNIFKPIPISIKVVLKLVETLM